MTDYEEILNLMSQYCRAIDDRDWDAMRDALAEDVRFDMGVATTETRDALFAHMEQNLWPAGRHLTMNCQIMVDGDQATATATSDWIWLDPATAIGGLGRYFDEFKRDDGRWVFAARRITYFQKTSD